MRKLVVGVEVSVDGVMGGDSPDFWQRIFRSHSADVQHYLSDLMSLPDALVMGRLTYEAFAEVWPAREGADADKINAMPKFVASRTLKEPLEWNASLLKGDTAAAIKELKEQDGTALLQYGVGELTNTLLQQGLVDELRLLVFPFTFGEGPRIFEHMGAVALQLVDTTPFTSGAVLLTYRPAN